MLRNTATQSQFPSRTQITSSHPEPIFKLPLYSSFRLSSLPLKVEWETDTLAATDWPSKDTLRNLLGKAFQRKTGKLEMRTIVQHTVHSVFFLSLQLLILILRSTHQIFFCNPCLNYMERKRETKLVSSRSHNRTRTKPSCKECLPCRKIFKEMF